MIIDNDYIVSQFVKYDGHKAYREAMKDDAWILGLAKGPLNRMTVNLGPNNAQTDIIYGATTVDIDREERSLVFRDSERRIHRTKNRPAFITSGRVEWGFHGKAHRVGGPAKIWGPAAISPNFLGWFVEGKAHRTDGPAKIWGTSRRNNMNPLYEFWVKGRQMTEEEFLAHFDIKESKFTNIMREIG